MSDLTSQVWDRVAHLTGRDLEELDNSLTLQGDLGFDSLKIMSLWQAVFGLLPAGISGDLNDFAAVETLGDLVDALEVLSKQEVIADDRAPMISESDPGGRRIPMAHAQQFFLLSHQLVQSTSLCSAIEVEGRIDLPRLRAAWQQLLDRHVNLRTCFYVPPDATKLTETEYRLLPDRTAPQVRHIPLGTPEAADWDSLFHDQLNRAWDLRQWPLHEVMVADLGDGREAILLANEHIISDGLGNQRLLADLVALYDNPGAVLPPVLNDEAYIRTVEEMNAYHCHEDEAEFKAREDSMRGLQSLWDPQGKLGHDTGAVIFRNQRVALDRALTARLKTHAAEAGVSLYALLLASLNACFRDRLSLQSGAPAILQVPTGGKVFPGIDLQETVSCFAQNLSIASQDSSGDLTADARALGGALREALIGGYDRTQSRLMALAMEGDFPMDRGLVPRFVLDQARNSLRGNLYAPYVGESPLPAQMSGLRLSGYRAATKNVAGTVDILHELHDGQLIAFVNYDAACFSPADIEAFLEDHLRALGALVAAPAETTEPVDTEPVDTAALQTLRSHCAAILRRDPAALEETADLQGALGLDSLGKIRLVNAVVPATGGRTLARQLHDCATLAEMAALLEASGAPKESPPRAQGCAPESAPTSGPESALENASDSQTRSGVQPMRRGLPEIPLRHIEAQAAATPEAEAVTDGKTSLTYGALNRAANQLAHTLAEAGVGQGDTVAVTCPRGPDMLVALLGILKLGAAYVPLDPAFPAERMRYIAEHARASVWVADLPQLGAIFAKAPLPTGLTQLIGLTDQTAELALPQRLRGDWSDNSAQPVAEISPDDLMVLLYTSGSTGKPKGVACHHRGYMNRLDWHHDQFQLRPGERVALKTSFSFDVSVWELFWPLMVGGTIVAASKALVSNPWALADWLAEQRIAVMHFVPSLFNEFVTSNCDSRLDLPHMRWLVFSGEALGVKPVRSWMTTQAPHIRLANLYGPTEASIDVTCEVIDQPPAPDQTRISIGRAIANTEMLILDDSGAPITAPGQQGELCIAGVQVASGYHRDILKTASAFTFNHLAAQGVPGPIIYRTGDLAMWHADGRIDYLGRKDSQIKLRGFRIELGEIEAVVASHPEVHEAAAVLRRSEGTAQDMLAVAYAPATVAPEEIRRHAAKRLAEYAVPDLLRGFDSLPKNHNGKLDRKALDFDAADPASRPDTAAAKVVPLAPQPSLISSPDPDRLLPVSPPQRALLAETPAGHCGASQLMLDYEAELDISRFTDAIRAVIAAHPALQSTFERRGARWMRRELAALPAFEPQLFDATMLDEEAFRREFDLVAKEAALALSADRWPLISVLVAKRSAGRCAIAILGSTLVGDMVGAFAFGRAIWQHYLGSGVSATSDASAPTPQVGDSQDLLRLYAAKDHSADLSWWQSHLGDMPDGSRLAADHPLADDLQGSTDSQEILFDLDETLALSDAVAAAGDIALYDVIAAALYRRLGAATGDRQVTVAHRVNGRNVLPEKIYFDSIDCFAYNVPLRLSLCPDEPLLETAQRHKALQEALPFKGYSYDALGPQLPASHWPAAKTTAVRLNFLGEARTPQNSAVRFVPGGSSGRIAPDHAQRSFALDCVAQLRQGQLALSLQYSTNLYDTDTITAFLRDLRTELAAVGNTAGKKEMTHAA